MERGGSHEPLPKRQKTQQEEEKAFRFSVGQSVLCNMSKRSGFLWKVGTIMKVAYRPSEEDMQDKKGVAIIPYVVKLDAGGTVATPEDHDECVRLAARCCDDTRVMRQLAVSLDKKECLRFAEGDRVAVQLDVGVWEEGVVVEAWAVPARNGRPLKTWAGFAVPYAVNLDLGHTVLVPFDTDEVVRAELAARPPQKSIAEQIGGTDRASEAPSESSRRFVTCQNPRGEWVCRDTRTGAERPCAPPCPDEGLIARSR
jgi:hypothetical protein